ncbi:MAG: YihY family inner membrane protein [Planctomycetes bacterium]|nr:YihY family inner membrane protein [Planctomycetota bacterium]
MSIHSRQTLDHVRRASGYTPTGLLRLLARVEHWFHANVFAYELEKLPRGQRLVNHWLRVVYLATRGFFEDQCLFRASALTYITVLSLVPMLAFSFAVAKGMGFYQDLIDGTIRPFVARTFEGGQEMRQAFEKVLEFVDGTKVSGLGAVGLLLLLYTVIKLLSSIEASFNHIWGAQRSRSLVRKLTDYLAMVVVTPILLFAAAGITTAAQSSDALAYAQRELHMGALFEAFVKLAPLLSLWLAFAFVYLAMPNARTRLRSAIVGALVGGSLWQLTLLVHIQFQLGIARYNAIYSGFAMVPIFLIWVQLSWVMVLLGAEVCFAHQSAASYYPDSPEAHSLRERERIALRALARIGARSLRGEPGYSAAELASALGVSLRPLELVLADLVEGGLVACARSGGADTFLLARDIDRIQVKHVLDLFRGPFERQGSALAERVDAEVSACLVGLDEALGESRHNLPLRVLAEQEPASSRSAERERSSRS